MNDLLLAKITTEDGKFLLVPRTLEQALGLFSAFFLMFLAIRHADSPIHYIMLGFVLNNLATWVYCKFFFWLRHKV